jgi:hypothetical protein
MDNLFQGFALTFEDSNSPKVILNYNAKDLNLANQINLESAISVLNHPLTKENSIIDFNIQKLHSNYSYFIENKRSFQSEVQIPFGG